MTGSPGHSSGRDIAHPNSGTHPFHTEGGRLREDALRSDAAAPEHKQNGSGYYQQFQETSPTFVPEQYAAESAPFSQIESSAANTNADVQMSAGADADSSTTIAAEPPATLRQTDELPLTPKLVGNHAVREVPVDTPLSGDCEAAPPMSERPGRLRFDVGTTSAAQKKQRQSGTKYARKFTQDAEEKPLQTTTDSADHSAPTTESGTPEPDDSGTPASDSGTSPPPGKKSSRLQFDAEELPPGDALDRKISKLQGKVGKTDAKLKKTQEHLPTKRKLRADRTFDTEKGKPQRKIRFEQEVKSQREHLKGALPTRPVKAGANAAVGFAHGKIHQVEHENVEVEATHKGELIAESATRRASARLHHTQTERHRRHFPAHHADKGDQYPLVEWGMTEADALKACYDRGFDFGGLYEIYRRCSCWCCPFQRIGELKKLRQHHPELWARLLQMDNRARAMFGVGPLGQFKKDWSVERLEARFAQEEQNSEHDRRTSI